MIDYKHCAFYKLQSKQNLKELIFIKRDVYLENTFINRKIKVFINQKERLIESPDMDIRAIQRNILRRFEKLTLPDYIFSGIKHRGYVQMRQLHATQKYFFCFDIQKFFYNISREAIYKFYKETLQASSDVAEILTNYSSINLRLKEYCGSPIIKKLIKDKTIIPNHLIAGAPQSVLLSFLVNEDMYEELNNYSLQHRIIFSAYADDFFFSSNFPISKKTQLNLIKIVKKYNYNINENKIRYLEQTLLPHGCQGEKEKVCQAKRKTN